MMQSFRSLVGLPDNANGGPANPQLIRVPDDYEQSKLRVVYFGQETNGWEGPFSESKGVQSLQHVYHDFVNLKPFAYGGQYWNAVKSFQNEFWQLEPKSRFAANNVIKIGRAWDKGAPPPSVIEWQSHWFDVIREEMALLKPDVVLFFSGPFYDSHIERIFPGALFQSLTSRSSRELARVSADGLPNCAFRTYHPNYGYRNDFYPIQNEILEAVKTEFRHLPCVSA